MVLVVGDITVDISAPLPKPPLAGDDCLSSRLSLHCGGVGLNAAFALTRLGVPVRLISCVGQDAFGDFVLGRITAAGIDTRYVQPTESAMTGLFTIAISPDGQRTFIGGRGANEELRVTPELARSMEGIDFVQIAGYVFLAKSSSEFADAVIAQARRRSVPVLLDLGLAPCRERHEKLTDVFPLVDIVVANIAEADALTGVAEPRAAFAALQRVGAREVMLKTGGEGCLIRHNDQLLQVPGFEVAVVDTTGAGDAFNAGLIAGLRWGWPSEWCALFANACGAAAATIVGAGEELPGIAAIEKIMCAASFGHEWDAARVEIVRELKNRSDVGASRGA